MITVKKDLPIFTMELGDPFNLHELIPKYREKNCTSHISNVDAWHSNFHTHKQTTMFNGVMDFLVEKSQQVVSEYYDGMPVPLKCENLWVMEYRKRDFARLHCHYPAAWAGVYYIDCDEESSPLLIEGSVEVQPTPGLFVLFPGIIMHEVLPTKTFRRALALNFLNDL